MSTTDSLVRPSAAAAPRRAPGPRASHRQSRRPQERVRLLGAVMDLVKAEEVMGFVQQRRAQGQGCIIANHNLHSLYLLRRDAGMRAFFEAADLVQVDSLPLILWARLTGRRGRRFHRCTYLDWRDLFWRTATANGWRVAFVGGSPGVAERARRRILADYPQAQLSVHHGFFDLTPGSAEGAAVTAGIAAGRADVVLVGLGMPLQERWIMDNRAALGACAFFSVGGAFDYEAGAQTPAPRWLGKVGLEWLFRLVSQPRRMFRRYCVEPWSLAGPALADLGEVLSRAWARRRDLRR